MAPLRAILQFCPKKRKDSLYALEVTLDGCHAVSGSSDKTLRVWDLATWETKARLQGYTSLISAVAITHDGCRVVSGSNDKSLPAWDPQLEKPRQFSKAAPPG